jgi:N-acetylmuramoyl-L-alanine amidase|nr:MAG TPA: Endolysin [Caudoviricetes sp.]
MQLTRLMVPESKYNIKCPYSMNADGICVHNTANKASAMSEISYMVGNNNKVSYHYAIDDYRIVQGIEENRNAWHAGDGSNGKGNRNKIAIEICYSTSPDADLFNKAERLAAQFIAYKLKEKGWGIERVSKHQDYSGKYCPHKTLDLGWERFLNLIRSELGTTEPENTQPAQPSQNVGYTVKITASVLNVRDGAGTNYKINTTVKKNEVYTIVEENNGWGKLKSGAGWISLSYTTRNNESTSTPSNSIKYVLGLYVVVASALNVRSGAGINYSIKRTYKKGTRFDTYEIKNNWARTPSGWVCLDYCNLIKQY